MKLLILVSIIVLIKFTTRIDAVDCTDEEDKTITEAYTTAASTTECAEYSSVSDLLITIMPPCSATECVSVVKQLAESIPNCTTNLYSRKDLLLDSIDICSTPAPTPASTASSTNCTSEQEEATFNAFYEAANGSCASSTSIEMHSIIIDTECTSTCATAVRTFAESLPNCNYRASYVTTNKKQDIATQFNYCQMLDDATNISIYVDSAENLLGSAAGPTTIVPNCTTQEIEDTIAFYKTVATNASCVHDSSVCAYDIHLNADCDSPCGDLIQTLGIDVPRCYFEHVNHRERLSDSWYQCEWIVNPVNISTSFHYSDILNTTMNSSVTCNSNYDSTVDSDDNSLTTDSQSDSAAKPHQDFTYWIAAAIVTSTLAI
ncbi:Elicitin [Phytophthora megakarya]|uniref:Elicitin n=1 Tax=Phytophthora megakarya TaxID=4795 RepID=A0A225VIQ7_9STRA|nr:Elicitin [Phytophthora megakarya]